MSLVKRKDVFFILFFAVLFFFFPGTPAYAGHVTYVLITVDTEGPSSDKRISSPSRGRFLLPDQIHAKAKGISCGISRMMDIADKYKDKISFFLDVTEVKLFGESTMEGIARYIQRRGHDVQLHVDSLYLYDPERPYFYQYTLEEQTAILREEKEHLRKWTGMDPVAFRAGAYGANIDTLKALIKVNIPVDSSLFYGNRRCHINDLYSTKNMVVEKYGIFQIPVTVFQKLEYAEIAGHKTRALIRYKKVDIDSCDADEIISAITQCAQNDLDAVILFLHSHSFIKSWHENPEKRMADVRDISEFDRVLGFITKRHDVAVLPVSRFYEGVIDGDIVLSHKDFVPKVVTRTFFLNYIRRLVGINRGNFKQWAVGIVLAVCLGGFLFFRFIRKRANA